MLLYQRTHFLIKQRLFDVYFFGIAKFVQLNANTISDSMIKKAKDSMKLYSDAAVYAIRVLCITSKSEDLEPAHINRASKIKANIRTEE